MNTDQPRDQLSSLLIPPGIARLVMGGTAKPWHVVDDATFRPGYSLTPQRLWTIYRLAEIGQPAAQCDTFEDLLENDGHTRGQYLSRIGSVAFRPWIIQPGAPDAKSRAAAADLGAALRETNMLAALWHAMEAIGYGWSGINIAWEFDAQKALVKPSRFLLAPHRRFITLEGTTGELRFVTPEQAATGVSLPPGEWFVPTRPHRKTFRAGLLRTAGWWCLFKRMSIRDWMVFAERFGIPIVLGSYDEKASPESRMALMQAVQDIGTDGQAVLANTTKIAIENTATRFGDVGSLHPSIAAACNAEISKILTGATLNTESGGPGSFALGKVHENRSISLSFGDAFWLQAAFNEQVCTPFVKYNPKYAGATPPLLQIRVQPEMSPKEEVSVYSQLQLMGLDIEDEQMYERFGLRRPELGSVLKPLYAAKEPSAPSPKPGGAQN